MNIKITLLFSCLFSVTSTSWAKTPLVLLSIDGFAQRYIEQYQPDTLISLIENGTSAKALLPVAIQQITVLFIMIFITAILIKRINLVMEKTMPVG